jgi:penicillin V acylase-like amidase (Ntn superfamily)
MDDSLKLILFVGIPVLIFLHFTLLLVITKSVEDINKLLRIDILGETNELNEPDEDEMINKLAADKEKLIEAVEGELTVLDEEIEVTNSPGTLQTLKNRREHLKRILAEVK